VHATEAVVDSLIGVRIDHDAGAGALEGGDPRHQVADVLDRPAQHRLQDRGDRGAGPRRRADPELDRLAVAEVNRDIAAMRFPPPRGRPGSVS
jgi:hypothetical protein